MKHRKAVLVVPLIIAVLLIAGCPDMYKQALVFARDAATINAAVEKGIVTARNDGFIPDDHEYANLLRMNKKLAQLDDAAVSAITNIHDKAGAIAQIDQAVVEVDNLIASGLAGIKNPDKVNTIRALLLSFRGTLVSAKALLS